VFDVFPESASCPSSRRLAHDVERLNRLRFGGDRREEILATLIRGMKALAPGFAMRRMRWADVVRACRREGIRIVWGAGVSQSGLVRPWGEDARVRLSPYLSPEAAVFCAFTELAHWLGHPMTWQGAQRLGVLDAMHQEASTLGYLALFPHPAGRPYPIFLDQVRLEGDRGRHYRLSVWQPTRRRAGSVTWTTRHIGVLWYPQLPLPEDRPWFADGGAWG
jgi:hypothetical protein